jgi:hypothetical protein
VFVVGMHLHEWVAAAPTARGAVDPGDIQVALDRFRAHEINRHRESMAPAATPPP